MNTQNFEIRIQFLEADKRVQDKIIEAQQGEIERLQEALTNLLVWMGEGTRKGRPMDLMGKRDTEYYLKPARAAGEQEQK